MSEYLLRAVDIYKAFGGVKALQGVTLEIKPGEIHCLAGENGCGKSTLIKIISGVYGKDSGTIEFNGETLENFKPLDAVRKGIQVIYQDFSVFPNLTVRENLAINTELLREKGLISWKKMQETAEKALDSIGLHLDLDETLGSLSVAEKQMVAICRALVVNAKLIIMDEPTTALTKKEVKALFEVILKLKERGIAILFVSHKLDEVFEISERFTIFRSGKMVASGDTSELNDRKFTYYMTGRDFEAEPFEAKNVSDFPIMKVKELCKEGVFENIDFELRKGEILGITGLLDSGRSELALSLFGINPSDSGRIEIDGKEVKIKSPQDAIKQHIGYVPADRLSEGLFLKRSIGKNILIARIDDISNKAGFLNKLKNKNEIKYWVQELSIKTPDPDNAVQTLSGGNQQRVVLAKWLACKPEILILNGPTVGVDIGSKHEIHQILHSLANNGMAIIIISDDLPEIIENCSKIMVMKSGRIVDLMTNTEASEKAILNVMM